MCTWYVHNVGILSILSMVRIFSRYNVAIVILLSNVLSNFVKVWMFAYAEDELCFSVIGDIGGLPRFPFQTTSQRKVAGLLAKVIGNIVIGVIL